jgi:hypothetical protein
MKFEVKWNVDVGILGCSDVWFDIVCTYLNINTYTVLSLSNKQTCFAIIRIYLRTSMFLYAQNSKRADI